MNLSNHTSERCMSLQQPQGIYKLPSIIYIGVSIGLSITGYLFYVVSLHFIHINCCILCWTRTSNIPLQLVKFSKVFCSSWKLVARSHQITQTDRTCQIPFLCSAIKSCRFMEKFGSNLNKIAEILTVDMKYDLLWSVHVPKTTQAGDNHNSPLYNSTDQNGSFTAKFSKNLYTAYFRLGLKHRTSKNSVCKRSRNWEEWRSWP